MTFTVRNVDWKNAKHKLSELREKVFVYEWRIPKECEFDQHDYDASHVLVLDERQQPIATGRLTHKGEIGRIAVVPEHRKPAVYQALFHALINKANLIGLQKVFVQCELDGVEYYQHQGFEPVGAVYMDAGIARQKMACCTSDFSLNRVELTH
ncbi:GNAT family N-acetyltransferase [Aliiglaciecola litoralis]|uniref:N-acetyltransferase domain-containing protein n=1 Tax=Aliiglaciecola litoralis TaxID=582857 RepID=A0ABN1LCP3_9ALTE